MNDLRRDLGVVIRDIKAVEERLIEMKRKQHLKPGRRTIAEWMRQDGDSFQKSLACALKNNPILERLSFQDIQGYSLAYMTIEGSVIQPLEMLSVEVDISQFGDHVDDLANSLADVALPALVEKFMHLFFYGNPQRGVKGLHQLIGSRTTVHGIGTGSALSHTKLLEMLGQVHEPELIVSTPRISLSIMSYLQSIGEMAGHDLGIAVGVASYKEIPWVITEALRETEVAVNGAYGDSVGGNCSSVFALNFNALHGIHNGGIVFERKGNKGYFKWLVGVILKDILGCGKVDGIASVLRVVA